MGIADHRPGPAWAAFVAATLVGAASGALGNSSLIQLEPDLRHVPALAEVEKDVGVLYPAQFRGYVYTSPASASGAGIFDVGRASARIFDEVIRRTFRRVAEVSDAAQSAGLPISAVLVPEVGSVSIEVAPPLAGRWRFVWARVTYRLTVTTPEGKSIASWEVTGTGETVADSRSGSLDAVLPRLLTRCLEEAGTRLMRSFYDVPEARRWARDLPAENATVRAAYPVSRAGTGAGPVTWTATVPGIARIEVSARDGARGTYRVKVRNEAPRRLLVSPASVVLETQDGARHRSVPLHAYAAARLSRDEALADLPGYIPPPPVSLEPTFFATWNLIYALGLMAAQLDAENRAKDCFDAQLQRHRGGELREERLASGAVGEGDVHFLVLEGNGPPRERRLLIPVVDVEGATRHEVLFEIPADGGGR